MKIENSNTSKGLTSIITREKEDYLVIEDRSQTLERIDIDFNTNEIRVYSDKPWSADLFKRNGTPVKDQQSEVLDECF